MKSTVLRGLLRRGLNRSCPVWSGGLSAVATTTPSGLPAWGPRCAPGSVIESCCALLMRALRSGLL